MEFEAVRARCGKSAPPGAGIECCKRGLDLLF
jgi:hypothetical protein